MTRIYKRIVYTTQWWQNQSTGRSMGSFNPSYALHSLQCTSSSIASLPSQTVTFSRLKSFPTRLSFCVLKKYNLSFDIRCFLWYEQMQWKRWKNTKKNLSAFFLYSASSIQKYFLKKLDHVPQIAVMLENLYSKTAIGLFPVPSTPSYILAAVCSSRRCYKRLDHGLDSFPFFSRSLALFLRNALRI